VNYDTYDTCDNRTTFIQRLIRLSVFRRVVSVLALISMAVLVSACGSKRVIQTSDDSADYKSARSLPPLKKPSQVAVQTSTGQTATAEVSAVAAEEETAPESFDIVEEPLLDELAETEPLGGDSPATLIESESAEIDARVIEGSQGAAQLEISTGFDPAWRYLSASLQKSDVTVFSRTKSAGRFAVGCSGIAEDTVSVQQKGRWSFFKRDKNQKFEYCSLKMVEKRGVTLVSVLDRNGSEVASENSAGLFERILNN